jgi:hypothetical protein
MMEFFMSFLELRIRHMRIYLGRRYRGMSEEFLYDAYIGAIGQECRSKWMPESMSMEIFENSCFQSIGFYRIGDEKSTESDIFITE